MMLQAAVCDGVALDAFSLGEDRLRLRRAPATRSSSRSRRNAGTGSGSGGRPVAGGVGAVRRPRQTLKPRQAAVLAADREVTALEIGRDSGLYPNGNSRTWAELGSSLIRCPDRRLRGVVRPQAPSLRNHGTRSDRDCALQGHCQQRGSTCRGLRAEGCKRTAEGPADTA